MLFAFFGFRRSRIETYHVLSDFVKVSQSRSATDLINAKINCGIGVRCPLNLSSGFPFHSVQILAMERCPPDWHPCVGMIKLRDHEKHSRGGSSWEQQVAPIMCTLYSSTCSVDSSDTRYTLKVRKSELVSGGGYAKRRTISVAGMRGWRCRWLVHVICIKESVQNPAADDGYLLAPPESRASHARNALRAQAFFHDMMM